MIAANEWCTTYRLLKWDINFQNEYAQTFDEQIHIIRVNRNVYGLIEYTAKHDFLVVCLMEL